MKVLQQTFLSGECYIRLALSPTPPSSPPRSADQPCPSPPPLLRPLLITPHSSVPSFIQGLLGKSAGGKKIVRTPNAAMQPPPPPLRYDRGGGETSKKRRKLRISFSLSLSLSLSSLPRSYLSIHRLYRTAPSLPLSNQFLFPLPSCFSTCRIARCNNDGSSLRPAEAKVGVGGEVIEKSAAEGTER